MLVDGTAVFHLSLALSGLTKHCTFLSAFILATLRVQDTQLTFHRAPPGPGETARTIQDMAVRFRALSVPFKTHPVLIHNRPLVRMVAPSQRLSTALCGNRNTRVTPNARLDDPAL